MSNARFRTALLGSGAAVALMAASVPASADEINELRGQIEAMQSKLATLEQNQEAIQQEQQYTAAPANAVVGGDKPGSFRLPGSNTSVAIGGYAKLDIIYDFQNDAGDSFAFSGILPNNSQVRDNLDENFRLHAKQSRLWVKTWTPTDWGEFATHIEGDFEGAGGNEQFSNSTTFRLRHAYGRLGNVLAGQTWTNFSTPFEWPGTIDFYGTVGTSFVRQAQLRYTAPFGNGMSLSVAIENPETDGIVCNFNWAPPPFNPCPPGSTWQTTTQEARGNQNATDPAPDLTARFQWGANWGTVAVAGVGRYFRVVETATPAGTTGTISSVDDTAFGWGVNAAAVINMPWGKDSLGVQGLYGDGIGRYAVWGPPAFYANDQAIGFPAVDIDTVEAWGGNVWYEHWWTGNLYSVVSGGYAKINYPSGLVPVGGLTDHIISSHVNLQWKPTARSSIGIEGMYGHRELVNGVEGDAVRIQMGFLWGFST